MWVAVGGKTRFSKPFEAKIGKYIRIRKRERSFNIGFCRDTLDIRETELDDVHSGSTAPKTTPEWTETTAQKRADRIASLDGELVIAGTPDKEVAYLEVLLDPIDTMVLVTEEVESDEVNEWKRIATNSAVEITHLVVVGWSSETTEAEYWIDENEITVLRVVAPGEEMEVQRVFYDKTRNNLQRLADELIEMAVGDL